MFGQHRDVTKRKGFTIGQTRTQFQTLLLIINHLINLLNVI